MASITLLGQERVLVKRKDTFLRSTHVTHILFVNRTRYHGNSSGGGVVSGLRFQISIRRRSLQRVEQGDGRSAEANREPKGTEG